MKNVRAIAIAGCILAVQLPAPAAHAGMVFDDFEDGDHAGWLASTTGGSGSTSVEPHNASQMAVVQHTGRYRHSLSRDFVYGVDKPLSFDMHAVANSATGAIGGTIHARSGVIVSLLNVFNITIGTASLLNATNPGALGPTGNAIDGTQHTYSVLMGDFATLAGLDASDAIAKLSLSFFADASSYFGGNIYPNYHSSATVWFDNVTVGAVPVPGAIWLLGSGVLFLVGRGRSASRR